MKTVAITGAGGAIGSVTAEVFSDAGWSLALIDYGRDKARMLREHFPEASVYDGDLTNEEDARRIFDEIHDSGELSAVLAIAGGFSMQAATDAEMADYERMMDLNFKTLFNTARATLPILAQQDDSFLLGVAAPAAEDGGAQMGLYAASKAAVAAYLKSLSDEYSDEGVRVSILYPMGMVDTEANRNSMPDGDPDTWIKPDELAASMLHLATRSANGHIKTLKVYSAKG